MKDKPTWSQYSEIRQIICFIMPLCVMPIITPLIMASFDIATPSRAIDTLKIIDQMGDRSLLLIGVYILLQLASVNPLTLSPKRPNIFRLHGIFKKYCAITLGICCIIGLFFLFTLDYLYVLLSLLLSSSATLLTRVLLSPYTHPSSAQEKKKNVPLWCLVLLFVLIGALTLGAHTVGIVLGVLLIGNGSLTIAQVGTATTLSCCLGLFGCASQRMMREL